MNKAGSRNRSGFFYMGQAPAPQQKISKAHNESCDFFEIL
jgi:hypothetical protein